MTRVPKISEACPEVRMSDRHSLYRGWPKLCPDCADPSFIFQVSFKSSESAGHNARSCKLARFTTVHAEFGSLGRAPRQFCFKNHGISGTVRHALPSLAFAFPAFQFCNIFEARLQTYPSLQASAYLTSRSLPRWIAQPSLSSNLLSVYRHGNTYRTRKTDVAFQEDDVLRYRSQL